MDNNKIYQEHLPHSIHTKGFPIFLAPDEVEKSDEYSNGDPHGVAKGIHGEFQNHDP